MSIYLVLMFLIIASQVGREFKTVFPIEIKKSALIVLNISGDPKMSRLTTRGPAGK